MRTKSFLLTMLALAVSLTGCQSMRNGSLVSDFDSFSSESEQLTFDDPFNEFSNPDAKARVGGIGSTRVTGPIQTVDASGSLPGLPGLQPAPTGMTSQPYVQGRVPFPAEGVPANGSVQTAAAARLPQTAAGVVPAHPDDVATPLLPGMPTIDQITDRQAPASPGPGANVAAAWQQLPPAPSTNVVVPQPPNAALPGLVNPMAGNDFAADPFEQMQASAASAANAGLSTAQQQFQQQQQNAANMVQRGQQMLQQGQQAIHRVSHAAYSNEEFRLPANAGLHPVQPASHVQPASVPQALAPQPAAPRASTVVPVHPAQGRPGLRPTPGTGVIQESTSGWKTHQ